MSDSKKTSSVYTIPAFQPFLETVAKGILDKAGNDPLQLADFTILVPDRETGFALRRAFSGQLEGKTSIMPQIGVPGDLDDELLSLKISDNAALSKRLMKLQPAVSRLHRQLILADEILKIPGMASSQQKAIKLGGELGKFLDEVQRHSVDLTDIEKLVPDAFKDQWSKTADFLEIITKTWPEKLKKMGRIDPEIRKNEILRIQADHWKESEPGNPVIALGFYEAFPAMQSLLKSVLNMSKGSIILQGFDRDLDLESQNVLTSVHPQYALKSLLKNLSVDYKDVQLWEADPIIDRSFIRAPNLDKTNKEREKLLREAMRPAGTTEGWTKFKVPEKKTKRSARKNSKIIKRKPPTTIDVQALNGLDFITCGTSQEEASVIALKMRESLEQPGRKVSLVTADRSLARRVSARLRNWQIKVPDEAGIPLSKTSVGIYLLSTASMAANEWAPVSILETLKHPLSTMGEEKKTFRKKVSVLEDLAFHGARPGTGPKGVKGVLTAAFNRAARNPKHRLTKEELEIQKTEVESFVQKLEDTGKDFFGKMKKRNAVPFKDLLDAHIIFAEAMACDDKTSGADRIWCGDDGVKATRFLTSLREVSEMVPAMTGRAYLDVLQGLMQGVTVRTAVTSHPTLRIMTPAQAQLLTADIVILGGVNDDVWPQQVNENPWLSPDMIKKLGLPAPEEAIGREAHRFVQMSSNPNVMLTRAMRSGDAPSVSSPFLTRLMMVLRAAGLESAVEKKTRLLDIHTAMHVPVKVEPILPPKVTPPVSLRPKELPVTAIQTLMRDPYSVYVKYVLKLSPKAPLDASPNVSEKGIFTHDALDAFVKKYPKDLPENAEEELLKIGRQTFKDRINNPTVRAFWWPRFERIAKWFVTFERERREMSRVLATEIRGKLEIDMGDGVFTLTSIADRLDRDENDKIAIIDYKTGAVPSQKSVALGFSPQLTLEALIAFTGGFKGIDAADVGKLQYWKLSGGRPAGEVTSLQGDIENFVAEGRTGVESLIKAFNKKTTPYLPVPRAEWAPRYNNTEHLSRIGEWGKVKKVNNRKKPKKPTLAKKRKGGK